MKIIKVISFFIVISLFGCVKTDRINIDFNEDRAFELLVKQTKFGARIPNSEEIELERGFIINYASKLGIVVKEQEFFYNIGLEKIRGVNIIASFYPRKSRRIMIAAHYDCRPWADKDSANKNNPVIGANDGASGVAVLLELSNILKENIPSNYGVDLVFFDGEDSGIYEDNSTWCHGSRFFAKNFIGKKPEISVVIDMVGAKNLCIPIEEYSFKSNPELVSKIWNYAKDLGFNQFKNKIGYAVYDDHIPLIEEGFKAIDIIGVNYEFWHTNYDITDNCSANSLDAVGQTLVKLIYGD